MLLGDIVCRAEYTRSSPDIYNGRITVVLNDEYARTEHHRHAQPAGPPSAKWPSQSTVSILGVGRRLAMTADHRRARMEAAAAAPLGRRGPSGSSTVRNKLLIFSASSYTEHLSDATSGAVPAILAGYSLNSPESSQAGPRRKILYGAQDDLQRCLRHCVAHCAARAQCLCSDGCVAGRFLSGCATRICIVPRAELRDLLFSSAERDTRPHTRWIPHTRRI